MTFVFEDRDRRSVAATGRQMAKSVQIRNFRGFRDADLPDCRRINVVVGENGSGKTALLEAIFLAAGLSPELALRARQWRGTEPTETRGSPKQISQALWGDLFFEFKDPGHASIRLAGEPFLHARELQIQFGEPRDIVIQLPRKKGTAYLEKKSARSEQLIFRWNLPNGDTHKSVAVLEDGRLKITAAPESPLNAAFFASTLNPSNLETAMRFSDLSKTFRTEALIESFRAQFPEVEGISIELSGGQPMLHASMRGQKHKFPVTILSGGMTKLIALLFAFPAMEGGIMLIDEIENGFFYKRFPLVWRALLDFGREYDVQIFASTHSLECLRSAAALADKSPDDFSLIRTVRTEGRCQVRQFSGGEFVSAFEADLEIR